MTLLLAGVLVVVVLALGEVDRGRRERDHRAMARQQAAAHEAERGEWTRERQLLLNRIKPETAQYVAPPGPASPAVPVPAFDDDDEYWAAVGAVSREELAEALDRHERGEEPA